MQYNKLGTTHKDVSAIVMGCWGIGGGYTWGEQDEKESIRTITTAVDLGINLFDTAEFYSDGYSEELVLSVDVLENLNAATETLKMQIGPNADPWRTASRIQ